jgi:hypothetical protein
MEPVAVLLLLVFGHLVADYPAQNTFLALGKNRHRDAETAEKYKNYPWQYVLGVHAGIHAGFVLLFTGSAVLCIAEFLVHFKIDETKSEGKISFLQDQSLHYSCKLAWWLLMPLMGTTPIIGPH